MKTNHLVTSLLVLVLSFALSGCAGLSTKNTSDLSCTSVDLNAMINSGNYQKKTDNFIIIQDATLSMNEKAELNSSSPSKLALSKGLLRCLNNSLPENFNVKAGMRIFGSLSSANGLVYGMSNYSKVGLEDGILAVKANDATKADIENPIGDAIINDLKQVSGRTAVIIFSDGDISVNNDPVAAAAAMKKMYGENVCIYTVLIGNDPVGKTTMEAIAAQGGCGFSTQANNLYMRPLTECNTVNVGKGMGDFVARVFLEMDDDKDGVGNSIDQCPNTPIGVTVDAVGCPLDSDGDGVPDYRDNCPDTPAGVKVDEVGCPIPLMEKVSVTLHVGFDFDKTDVKAQYNEDLEKVANLLKAYPKINVELEGYTDSIGTDEYNMDLSMRRAENVKKELVGKYDIDASRISTSGFGESNPVDTNDTEEGRQNNRRVVAQIEAMIDK